MRLLAVCVAVAGLACIAHHECRCEVSVREPDLHREWEDRLILTLSTGSIEEKKVAAKRLQEMRSTRAVPHLLREARRCCELARNSWSEPDPQSRSVHGRKDYVMIDGRKQPYVDYHAPIFTALEALTNVPYKESDEPVKDADEKWLTRIEAWCKTLPPVSAAKLKDAKR